MKILDLFSSSAKSCRLLVNLDGRVVEKYRHFKEFLGHNYATLTKLAELEQLYYAGSPFSMGEVEDRVKELLTASLRLVAALDALGGGKYGELARVLDRLGQELASLYYPAPYCLTGPLVLPLTALTASSYPEAGGKATNLALIQRGAGLPIPPGFVVTATAFGRFLEEARLARVIEIILASMDPEDLQEVEAAGREIRKMISNAPVPPALAQAILTAYRELEAGAGPGVRVAMRSSAVGEDTEATFAGMHATRLNVSRDELLEAYKEVVASKYGARALVYRLRFGLDDRDTPMCVAGVAMIDSRASGVIYTADPTAPDSGRLKISAIYGQGELLVGGEASPDEYFLDRERLAIVQRTLGRKTHRLVTGPQGGLRLEEVPREEQERPAIADDLVLALARGGLALEQFFQGPQDVEWAVDPAGRLFFLQSRPLQLAARRGAQPAAPREIAGHPILLRGGKTASPGLAAGRVCRAEDPAGLPEDAILVVRTASPDYARLMGRLRGLITDVGSVTSHLASVAREFGVPALVDTGKATAVLHPGQEITLAADEATVYEGVVAELLAYSRPQRQHLMNSPMHRRLRAVLDRLTPLNLTDPQAPEFTPAGCRTLHDVIRFAHERAMQEMFGLGAAAPGEAVSARLSTPIPLRIYLMDLGGGLKAGLTTCDEVTPEHVESIPLKALWQGLSHPGINWSGGIPVGLREIFTLLSQGLFQRPEDLPGADSFAIISREYLNLSAKFGYHYANLDAFVGERPEENFFSLQFAGGAGDPAGRALRLSFLGKVLVRLGCRLRITGDLLDASLTGLDRPGSEAFLDQVGRLLAASRLLDLALRGEEDVDRLVTAFFQGDYDFFRLAQEKSLPGFYTPVGDWRQAEEDGRRLILQDGSSYARGLSSGLAGLMGKLVGVKYLHFLDNIGAYFYFPLAVAKESFTADAVIKVRVKAAAGKIDQAAGLAFAIRDVGNYCVLRLNALEDNLILFEFVNHKRLVRAAAPTPVATGRWYTLAVEVTGETVQGFLDGQALLKYQADHPLHGYVGLWSKADSVSYFDALVIAPKKPEGGQEIGG